MGLRHGVLHRVRRLRDLPGSASLMICDHCGALGGHDDGVCPVREATARILAKPDPAPIGRLTFNGAYVGRIDGDGGLQGGSLFADEDGIVRWVSSGNITRDRTR